MPRHAAEGLRGVARRDVADVELAAGEDGVTAVVLAEVGPDIEPILESNHTFTKGVSNFWSVWMDHFSF